MYIFIGKVVKVKKHNEYIRVNICSYMYMNVQSDTQRAVKQ